MTADRLDPAAEARIREACPRHRAFPVEHEQFSVYLPSCFCQVQRAAIKADREARGPSADEVLALRCSKHYTTLPIVNMPDGKECAICLRDDERAHADALAEVHRELAAAPCMGELLGEDCGWCPSCRSKSALAAHDARRGK